MAIKISKKDQDLKIDWNLVKQNMAESLVKTLSKDNPFSIEGHPVAKDALDNIKALLGTPAISDSRGKKQVIPFQLRFVPSNQMIAIEGEGDPSLAIPVNKDNPDFSKSYLLTSFKKVLSQRLADLKKTYFLTEDLTDQLSFIMSQMLSFMVDKKNMANLVYTLTKLDKVLTDKSDNQESLDETSATNEDILKVTRRAFSDLFEQRPAYKTWFQNEFSSIIPELTNQDLIDIFKKPDSPKWQHLRSLVTGESLGVSFSSPIPVGLTSKDTILITNLNDFKTLLNGYAYNNLYLNKQPNFLLNSHLVIDKQGLSAFIKDKQERLNRYTRVLSVSELYQPELGVHIENKKIFANNIRLKPKTKHGEHLIPNLSERLKNLPNGSYEDKVAYLTGIPNLKNDESFQVDSVSWSPALTAETSWAHNDDGYKISQIHLMQQLQLLQDNLYNDYAMELELDNRAPFYTPNIVFGNIKFINNHQNQENNATGRLLLDTNPDTTDRILLKEDLASAHTNKEKLIQVPDAIKDVIENGIDIDEVKKIALLKESLFEKKDSIMKYTFKNKDTKFVTDNPEDLADQLSQPLADALVKGSSFPNGEELNLYLEGSVEDDDPETLELFLNSATFEDNSEKVNNWLQAQGITDDNSLPTILRALKANVTVEDSVSIIPYDESSLIEGDHNHDIGH